MKTKRLLLAFLILLNTVFLCSAPGITAYADTGPKPSIEIEVIGIEGEYYMDLLVDGAVNSTSSARVYSDLNVEFVEYADALKVFRNTTSRRYWNLDGTMPMVSGHNLGLTDAGSVDFGYMVPTQFKIVIIKENKDIIVASEFTRTQFNSKIMLDLTSNVNLMEGETNIYEFTGNVLEVGALKEKILGFLYRLFITLAVELLIAIFIFKITKKQAIKIIIIVNVLTQIMLNVVLLNLPRVTLDPVMFYSVLFLYLEVAIICSEMIIYKFIKGFAVDASPNPTCR